MTLELENGTYRGKAREAALGKAKNGTMQIGVLFDLLDHLGDQITWYGFFTDAAEKITVKGLRTAGFLGDDLTDLSSLSREDTPEVLLVIENEEYEGRWTAKVKWVNSAGGLGMKNQIVGDEAKAFAAKMKGAFVTHDARNGKPQAQGTQRPSSPRPAAPRPAPSQSGPPPGHPAEEDLPVEEDLPF